jgi:hypothetical protein
MTALVYTNSIVIMRDTLDHKNSSICNHYCFGKESTRISQGLWKENSIPSKKRYSIQFHL